MRSNVIRRCGFTLIELLVVVAIVMLLLALVGVVARNARAKAQLNRARALVKQIHVCLSTYEANYREFPPTASEIYPAPNYVPGVELDSTWLKDWEATYKFSKDDFDPTDTKYFIDPWRNRIRFRKSAPNRILVWSSGPNGIDEVGADAAGRRERVGDDITSSDTDF